MQLFIVFAWFTSEASRAGLVVNEVVKFSHVLVYDQTSQMQAERILRQAEKKQPPNDTLPLCSDDLSWETFVPSSRICIEFNFTLEARVSASLCVFGHTFFSCQCLGYSIIDCPRENVSSFRQQPDSNAGWCTNDLWFEGRNGSQKYLIGGPRLPRKRNLLELPASNEVIERHDWSLSHPCQHIYFFFVLHAVHENLERLVTDCFRSAQNDFAIKTRFS